MFKSPRSTQRKEKNMRKKPKKKVSLFLQKRFFSFWFPMSHSCGYSVCSLCRKNTKDLRNIPEAYTGPIFPLAIFSSRSAAGIAFGFVKLGFM